MLLFVSDTPAEKEMEFIDDIIEKIVKTIGVSNGSSFNKKFYEYDGNGTGIKIIHAEGPSNIIYNLVEFHGKTVYNRKGGSQFYDLEIDKDKEWKEQLKIIANNMDDPKYKSVNKELIKKEGTYN